MSTKPVTPRGFHSTVADALPGAVERLAIVLHPERVILFGSYAHGAPTPDSDVDLLVILDTDASTTERYLAVLRLLYPRPFPVDILVRTPAEIEQALRTNDFFSLGKSWIKVACFMSEPTNPLAWVERAEEDFAIAVASVRRKKPWAYGACFHAQQFFDLVPHRHGPDKTTTVLTEPWDAVRFKRDLDGLMETAELGGA